MPVTGEDSDKRVNARELFEWLDPAHRAVNRAWIERVFAMPSQRVIMDQNHPMAGQRVDMPARSAMRFGDAVGTVRTVIVCRSIRFTLVTSQTWKAECGLSVRRPRGEPKPPDDPDAPSVKERSRMLALEAFPEYRELFSRKRDEARAEAALIARYGAVSEGLVPSLNRTKLL